MKAKTICPGCKKEVIETCYGCIIGKTLIHCKFRKDGTPIIFENIKWKIIEK